MFDWQTIIALGIVALAAAQVVRGAVRWWRGAPSTAGGCSGCPSGGSCQGTPTGVPLVQIGSPPRLQREAKKM